MKRLLILTLILFFGCIDRIEVDTSEEPSRIVIDGFVTSEAGEYFIKISKTIPFSNLPTNPVSGALVQIISSKGEIETLEERNFGSYYTRYNFKAEEGVTYKLHVEVEGKVIESTEQELPAPATLGEINYVPEYRPFQRRIDNEIVKVPGVVITTRIDQNERNSDRYFLWALTATFMYEAPLARNDAVRICWITNTADFQDILLHKDIDGGYDHEISFIAASRNMVIDYSLEVVQYTISEEAYNFWSELKSQRENVGSIFDPPPHSIIGNLSNINDDKDIILGFFGVHHKSSNRMFWNLDDLPFDLVLQEACERTLFGRPPDCLNCLEFSGGGAAQNYPPSWWYE